MTTTPVTVTAAACLSAWDGTADDPPPLRGFIESSFSPLVAAVARTCLAGVDGLAEAGDRTAIVLGSVLGDTATMDAASKGLASGRVHSPLLFFQSVPSSVLGAVSREHGLTGPVTCLSATTDLAGQLLDTAALLLRDEDGAPEADRVLLLAVELGRAARTEHVARCLGERADAVPLPDGDAAVALFLERSTTSDGARPPRGQAPDTHPAPGQSRPPYGWLAPLAELARTAPATPAAQGNHQGDH